MYVKLLEAFIDEMQVQGKVTHADLTDFLAKHDRKLEAEKVVNDMFGVAP
jgi:ribosomal protein S18